MKFINVWQKPVHSLPYEERINCLSRLLWHLLGLSYNYCWEAQVQSRGKEYRLKSQTA